MYPITTTWTSASGPKSVSTYRETGQSDEDWMRAHFARVEAEMANHPPISES